MAWLFQDAHQVKRVGEKKASWSVGWYDPDGTKRQKSFGSGAPGKKLAFRFQKRIEAELLTGTYTARTRVTWDDFRREYNRTILTTKSDQNERCLRKSLDHFERLAAPRYVDAVGTKTLDEYVAARRVERGAKAGSRVSPATINKELRCLRAALNIAHDWGYLAKVPRFRWAREPKKILRYMTAEHFADIYGACDSATLPELPSVDPGTFWRALITFAYLTGWRVGELFELTREDLDLDTGTAITRHDDNKAGRDDIVHLHPAIIDHLRGMPHFEDRVFPWPHGYKQRWKQFHAIQRAAGIHLPCNANHEHTPACHVYGFHDVRRAFATENAATLSAVELQAFMRHRSFTTTQLYINMAKQLRGGSEAKLFVPDVLRREA